MRYTPLEHLTYLEELKFIIKPEDGRDIEKEIADVKKSIESNELFKEKLHAYTPPEYIPRDEEDETPDNDNPFQGREDDEHITSQLD